MTVSRSNQLKETTDEGNEKLIIIVSIIKLCSLQSHHGEIISKRKIYRRPFKICFFIFFRAFCYRFKSIKVQSGHPHRAAWPL